MARCRGRLRLLRFENVERENAYVRARDEPVRKKVMLNAAIGFLFQILGGSMRDPIWQAAPSDIVAQYKVVRYGTIGTQAFLLGTLFLVARVKLLSPQSLETASVIMATLLALLLPLASQELLSRLLGLEELLGKPSCPNGESTYLMMMNVLVACAHIGLGPVRWFKLVPFACAIVIAFSACTVFLRHIVAPYFEVAGFFALVIISSAGKRTTEIWERQNFIMVLAEKEKRFEAEHRMEGQHPAAILVDKDQPHQDQASVLVSSLDHQSLVSTTVTSRAFQLERDPLPSSIARLLEIGKQEQWLLSSSALRLLPNSRLGSGGFGMVVQGHYNSSEVAVKVPRRAVLDGTSDLRQLCNELRLLRRLRHPNIVTLYGACLDATGKDLALVLEFLRGETLLKYIFKRKPTSEVRLQLLDDVAAAFVYLHGRAPPIVHGDLKGENVFVEYVWGRLGSCRAKLLDFGLSLSRTKHARARGGTLHWMAPELLRREPKLPEKSADIYAMGCLIYFAVTGTPPRYGISNQQLMALASACQPLPPLAWLQAPLVASHRSLAESCCDEEPLQRPAIDELLGSLSGLKCQVLGIDAPKVESSLHQALEETRQAMLHHDTSPICIDPGMQLLPQEPCGPRPS